MQNLKDVDAYVQQISESKFAVEKGYKLSKEQTIVREAITDIMCNQQIFWEAQAKKSGISKEELLKVLQVDNSALEGFAADGLIELSEDGIVVTEIGSQFVRNVAASLDPDYKKQNNLYSKSV